MSEPLPTPEPEAKFCAICQQLSLIIDAQQWALLQARGEDLCAVCEELDPQAAACCAFIIVWDSHSQSIGG